MSLTCFSSRRSSNEDEKEDIRRLNTEDIFPENIAAPNIEEDEKCEHGNKFSPKITPANIESRNMLIHHTTGTKDSRNCSLQLMLVGLVLICGVTAPTYMDFFWAILTIQKSEKGK